MLDETISKYEKEAEKARAILTHENEMASKIREGLGRFDNELEETRGTLSIHEGSLVGTYVEGFVFPDKSEVEEQLGNLEAVVKSLERFLQKAPEIRKGLEGQLSECGNRIKKAELVLNQLAIIRLYHDLNSSENFSDKQLVTLSELLGGITTFKTEIFDYLGTCCPGRI